MGRNSLSSYVPVVSLRVVVGMAVIELQSDRSPNGAVVLEPAEISIKS